MHGKECVLLLAKSTKDLSMRQFTFVVVVLSLTATDASAQSVLERVLGQIDGASNLAQVNGTFANIADSIGQWGTETSPADTDVLFNVYSLFEDDVDLIVDIDVTYADLGTTIDLVDQRNYIWGTLTVGLDGSVTLADIEGFLDTYTVTFPDGSTTLWIEDATITDIVVIPTGTSIPSLATTIDGSITNIVTGVTSATQEAVAGAATATEFVLPTVDLGDMATTALGAVNTGEITLGVNSAVDEAKTSSTRAISAVMTQIGGSADTGALVLNVASNASAVNGSIENVMMAVNGSIGSASTTALGAVNTGTITSGVNAAVQGIVGLSGQSASGL
jgi:hypothetical protein